MDRQQRRRQKTLEQKTKIKIYRKTIIEIITYKEINKDKNNITFTSFIFFFN